ncbi:TldD/PmbA family protein [Streptomyces sp. MI02-7b]|uniref:TldD/PmbA family protein n=1 Tax=Streptomyces sp. MI02-7b TaxID=462941 RepID=UPI0029BE8905|nr:TldD/PmbA family protein [Streptomyces sp. MI02-7b]MDX3075931.1 TldD/PmbA family protein [Streptomyces sp. MI02-7b]
MYHGQGPVGRDRATEHLIDVAEWAVTELRRSADYVQVYVSRTLEIKVECVDGKVLATCVEPHEGLGCLIRQGTRWRYRHVSPSAIGELLSWPAAAGSGTKPDDDRAGGGMSGPVSLSGWLPAWQGAAHPPAFTPTPAEEWLVRDTGNVHSLRTLEDFTSRAFAVVDTEGIRAASASRTVRQRVEATVTVNGHHYRGLSRRLVRGADTEGKYLPGADGISRIALGHALDSAAAEVRGKHRTPVVFGPAAAAGFLHELVGHALEGDNFALHSDYLTRLRRRGAVPEPLTLQDDPTRADGYGSYDIDDEGVAAQVTTLLANGEIGPPLSSVRTVHRDGYIPTGNGRRKHYRDVAIPRASNTVALPGKEDPEALLHDGSGGVLYVGGLGAGMINLVTGEYSFAALNCFFITPGGHRVPARDVSLYGDALDTLGRIEGIGRDFGGDNISCGKQGQMIGIGIHSPSMRYAELDWSAA